MHLLRFISLFLTVLFTGFITSRAQPRVGDVVPTFTLKALVNTSRTTFSPADARGKVLILEFWGTWCAPCIPALMHLDTLQRQYPNDLYVVAISDDAPDRLQRFLKRKPVALPLASDRSGEVQELFQYQAVPHTVVVGRNGKIVAITTPDKLTDAVLQRLLRSETVPLAEKKDVKIDVAKALAVDTTTQYMVSVKPYVQGVSSQMRPGQGAFAGRRLTFLNVLPQVLFQEAYGFSGRRTSWQLAKEQAEYVPENLTCFDIIVPEAQRDSLRLRMQQELARHYARIKPSVEQRTVPCYVLTRQSGQPGPAHSMQAEKNSFSGRGVKMQSGKMRFLQDFLESQLRGPVLDETGLTGRYDIQFETRSEDLENSVSAGLAKYGLDIRRVERPVPFLVLR